jgi:hypothetical protein
MAVMVRLLVAVVRLVQLQLQPAWAVLVQAQRVVLVV